LRRSLPDAHLLRSEADRTSAAGLCPSPARVTVPAAVNADVILLPKDLDPARLADRAVAVFDVLRATTSITAALSVGVAEVRVFGDLDSCLAAAATFDGPKLTCGERHTLPPPGFDLGNSPGQFTPAHAGRTVFMTTTNGTKAIVAVRSAPVLVTAALVNATAAAAVLATAGRDVTLLCSGSDGAPSLEDTLGAGAVLHALQGLTDVTVDGDLARMALHLFAACRDRLPAVLADTYGGHNIRRVKLDGDITFAARLDVFDVVGRVSDGPLRVTP
jgi:2-phosphosulfolactate phosphatase